MLAVVVMGCIHIPPVLAPVLAFAVFHNPIGLGLSCNRVQSEILGAEQGESGKASPATSWVLCRRFSEFVL